MAHFESVQVKLGYDFIDSNLLNEAFIAAGAPVSRSDVKGPTQGNKRLALVGDAVLRLCILDEWYPTGADIETGDNLVRDFGTNENLKRIANEWNFTEPLEENPHQKGKMPKTTLASTVEAVIGAVWIDSQKDVVTVQHLLKKLLQK